MKVKEVIEKVNTNEYWSIYDFEGEFNLEVIDACVGGIGYHLKYEEMTNVYKCDDGLGNTDFDDSDDIPEWREMEECVKGPIKKHL